MSQSTKSIPNPAPVPDSSIAPDPRSPWRPTRFVQAATVFHAAVAAGLITAPQRWPTALKALALGHLVVGAAGMRPRSQWLGRALTRLPDGDGRIALTLDDGPDPDVTPRVLDLLDSYDAKATFFVIGRHVEAHPELARELMERGHRVENHTYRHHHSFAFLPYAPMRREIERAQRVIADATGREPLYFRAPAGMRNVFVDPVLHALDLTLVAWTRRGYDTVDHDVDRVTSRLCRGLRDGDVLLLHDGNGARDDAGRPAVLDTLPRLLDLLQRRGLRAVPLPDDLGAAAKERDKAKAGGSEGSDGHGFDEPRVLV